MNSERHMARMSKSPAVEVLREAVTAIRDEWGEDYGTAWNRVRNFHLSVAAWLENSADVIDGFAEVGKPASIVPPGCFAVARAYLGRS